LFFFCGVTAIAQKKSMVYLERSETLSFDEKRLPDVQILKGNVCFRHDSAWMYCDSAYFFEKDNSLHAFGHVHLVQGDSLEGFGDLLYYYGDTKLAKFRNNVRLLHDGSILTTDYLNYDRVKDIAYYFEGGMIEDSINTLTSIRGQYTPYNDQAVFSGEVRLVHPKFVLTSDTLCYNTASHRADLVSPTTIVYEEETTILSSNGWYNTETEISMLFSRSQIIHADGMTLTGDTIYYDKIAGHGQVNGNMQSVDSTHSITLYGNRGEVWENTDSGYATDSAMLVDWSDSTMYTYLHADTLFTQQISAQVSFLIPKDSVLVDSVWVLPAPDTQWVDTSFMRIRAFYNVRMYRDDIQLVCDSMFYSGQDSLARLTGNPVCWNGNNQVSADTVLVYFKNNEPDYLHGFNNAIAVKREGENEYDQMAGKEMFAYVRDGDIYLVDVKGNAETIFYPREEDGTYLGVNKTQSSYVKVFLTERTVDYVVFTTATSGVMSPLSKATDDDKFLGTFFWADIERPRQPGDIFLRPTRTPRPDAQKISAASDDDEEEEDEQEEDLHGSPSKRNVKK
jgi:lipopolysaccharide export system protein LptA